MVELKLLAEVATVLYRGADIKIWASVDGEDVSILKPVPKQRKDSEKILYVLSDELAEKISKATSIDKSDVANAFGIYSLNKKTKGYLVVITNAILIDQQEETDTTVQELLEHILREITYRFGMMVRELNEKFGPKITFSPPETLYELLRKSSVSSYEELEEAFKKKLPDEEETVIDATENFLSEVFDESKKILQLSIGGINVVLAKYKDFYLIFYAKSDGTPVKAMFTNYRKNFMMYVGSYLGDVQAEMPMVKAKVLTDRAFEWHNANYVLDVDFPKSRHVVITKDFCSALKNLSLLEISELR